MAFTITINGHEYTSDPANTTAPAGNRFIGYGYITALANLAVDIVAVAGQALGYRDAAAASAATALAAPGTQATSTVSLTIGTGSKSLNIQTGKAIVPGMSIKVAATASPTNWMHGDVTAYDSGTGALDVTITSANGSGTFAAWTVSLSAPAGTAGTNGADGAAPREVRTTDTPLVAADKGKLIDCTGGTFTQTFAPCAELGNGWWCWVKNSGDGGITLAPSGGETIDGLAAFISYPGEMRLVECDGDALKSFVIQPFHLTMTSTGTFTKPPGYQLFDGLLWAGGGSGGKGDSGTDGKGGGGGACTPFSIPSANVGAVETVIIGAGGIAQAAADSNGYQGGTSSFGALIIAYGGGPGGRTTYTYGGGGGGILSAGGLNGVGGQPGYTSHGGATVGRDYSVYGGGVGGVSDGTSPVTVWGGAGGRNASDTSLPALSVYAGRGGVGNQSGTAESGVAPAGGGGGTRTGTSGAGARGELRIWGVI